MKKIVSGLFGTAALALGVVSCASSGWEPMAVTRDSSVVAACTKIDDLKVEDVKADEKLSDVEAERMLVEKARSKGANYVLIASEDARQGSAYRCSMAPAAATSGALRNPTTRRGRTSAIKRRGWSPRILRQVGK